jgi:hypothetical protein
MACTLTGVQVDQRDIGVGLLRVVCGHQWLQSLGVEQCSGGPELPPEE